MCVHDGGCRPQSIFCRNNSHANLVDSAKDTRGLLSGKIIKIIGFTSTTTSRMLAFYDAQVPYIPHILQQLGLAARANSGARPVFRRGML